MENKKKLIAFIVHDDWAESPFDRTDFARLLNVNLPNQDNFVEEEEWQNALKEAKEKGDFVFKVSCTDHSSFYLNIGDPIDRWDSCWYGFVIVNKSCLIEGSTSLDALRIAKDLIEEWNNWANGWVYGVQICEQEICACCGKVAREEEIDSCYGFYDTEAALDFIKDNYDIPEENITNKVC